MTEKERGGGAGPWPRASSPPGATYLKLDVRSDLLVSGSVGGGGILAAAHQGAELIHISL